MRPKDPTQTRHTLGGQYAMRPVAGVMGKKLLWIRPRMFARAYELRTSLDPSFQRELDTEVVATLRFTGLRKARAEASGEVYHIEEGWGPIMKLLIYKETPAGFLAFGEVRYRFRAGTLKLHTGVTLPLSGRPFRFEAVAHDPHGRFELLRTTKSLFGRGSVDVGGSGWASPYLPLLVPLTWFMVLSRARRAAN